MTAQTASAVADNWAVLVCTSAFWHNYRHVSNLMSLYRIIRGQGMPRERIIVMLADDIACGDRNAVPGTVFNRHHEKGEIGEVYRGLCGLSVDGECIPVAYSGGAVSVDSFMRLLTGMFPTPFFYVESILICNLLIGFHDASAI